LIVNLYQYVKKIKLKRIFVNRGIINTKIYLILGIGDWGLGIGDWGLGIGDGPNPQSPIPNPQSPIPILLQFNGVFI